MFLNMYTFTNKQEFIKKKSYMKRQGIHMLYNRTEHNKTPHICNCEGIIIRIISHSDDKGRATKVELLVQTRHNTRRNATTAYTASMQRWMAFAMLVILVLYCTKFNASTRINCFLIVEWISVAANQAQFKRNNGIQ